MAEQLGLKFDTDVVAAAEPAQQPADETSQGDINAD
jgi:hypothetical protein